MKNRPLNMEDAKRSDAMILELAFYQVTKGHMVDFKIKSLDEYNHMMVTVDKQFAEFKRLLISGETSWDKLSNDVYAKYACDLRKYFVAPQRQGMLGNEPTIFGFNEPLNPRPNKTQNPEKME